MTPAEADGVLFDGTTHCTEQVPLVWVGGDAVAAEVQERDTALLRLLGQLEEPCHEPREDKTPRDPELVRMAAKVDMLLHLVGTLVALHRPPPPLANVQLSCRGLVWRGAPPLTLGATGRVSLLLHPAVPLSLELGASVIAVDEVVVPGRLWLKFEPLTEALTTELERYTFRRHRRAVADLRQARAA